MPRSRGSSEMPAAVGQKQSPRAPLHLRSTACSEFNAVHGHHQHHQRIIPKVEDRRSPRSPLHEKKRGTRVADLETKLNQAHEELKKVKERLASTEQELQEFKKDQPIIQNTEQLEAEEEEEEEVEEPQHQDPQPEKNGPAINEDLPENETTETEAVVVAVEEGVANVVNWGTDVYEVVPSSSVVPSESESIKSEADEMDNKENNENDEENAAEKEEEETKAMIEEAEKKEDEFPDSPEVLELKAKLAERQKAMEIQLAENESLKDKASEASEAMAAAKAKEEEVGLKLRCLNEELRESRAEAERLKEKLGASEAANAALESEMKRLRVQSDQWRKAAETAAAVLANGDAMDANGGRRIGERCGSMDKHRQHIGNAGYGSNGGGFVGLGSPLIAEEVDEGGFVGLGSPLIAGSRKRGGGGGMRMFGDLWKKKSHQK